MPYSPNVTRVPPLAAPERPGWCCLRCLTRRGINMSGLRSAAGLADGLGSRLGHDGCGLHLDRRSGLGGGCGIGRRSVTGRTAAAGRALGPVTTVGPGATARGARGRGLLASELLGRDVALVDPDLD